MSERETVTVTLAAAWWRRLGALWLARLQVRRNDHVEALALVVAGNVGEAGDEEEIPIALEPLDALMVTISLGGLGQTFTGMEVG